MQLQETRDVEYALLRGRNQPAVAEEQVSHATVDPQIGPFDPKMPRQAL